MTKSFNWIRLNFLTYINCSNVVVHCVKTIFKQILSLTVHIYIYYIYIYTYITNILQLGIIGRGWSVVVAGRNVDLPKLRQKSALLKKLPLRRWLRNRPHDFVMWFKIPTHSPKI